MRLLRQEINEDNREYYIEKVNNPLLKAVTILASRYPEPTRENICYPTSIRLLEIQERFLEYEGNPRLRKLGKAVFRVIIDKNEHSPNFRDRFSWFFEEVSRGMKPRPYNHPQNDWNEPKPYGG